MNVTASVRVEKDAAVAVSSADLRAASAGVARFVSGRPQPPVLGGVLLESDGSSLCLSVFDYETSCRWRVDAAGDAFRTVAPARGLAEVCKGKGDAVTTVTVGAERVTVGVGGLLASLQPLRVDEFPVLPPVPEPAVVMSGAAFAEQCAQVLPAAGDDWSPPLAPAVALSFGAGTVTMAATDRYRLGFAQTTGVETRGEVPEAAPVVVPRRVLDHVARLAKRAECVRVGVTGLAGREAPGALPPTVGFAFGPVVVTSQTVTSDFPQWRRLVPDAAELTAWMMLDRRVWVPALQQLARLFSRNARASVTLTLTGSECVLDVEGKDGVAGSARVPCESSPDGFRIGFNLSYLLDGLKAQPGDAVRAEFIGAVRPALLSCPGSSSGYLLMPVTLGG